MAQKFNTIAMSSSSFGDGGGVAVMKDFVILGYDGGLAIFNKATTLTPTFAHISSASTITPDVLNGNGSRRTAITGNPDSNEFVWITGPSGGNGELYKATAKGGVTPFYENAISLGTIVWAGTPYVESYDNRIFLAIFNNELYMMVRYNNPPNGNVYNNLSLYKRPLTTISNDKSSWTVIFENKSFPTMGGAAGIISGGFSVGRDHIGIDSHTGGDANRQFQIYKRSDWSLVDSYTINEALTGTPSVLGNWSRDRNGRIYGAGSWTDDRLHVMTLITAHEKFFISNTAPNKPTNLNIGGTALVTSGTPPEIASLTPTISWSFTDPDTSDSQGAFEIQIYSEGGGTNPVNIIVNSSSSQYVVPVDKLLPNTVYDVHIQVKDAYGDWSGFQTAHKFKTMKAPTAIPTSPLGTIDTPQGTSLTPRFQWTYSDPESHVQNRVYIDIFDGVTNALVFNENWKVQSYNYYDVPEGTLVAGKKYKWQVRVEDTSGMKSALTTAQYFITNHPPTKMTVLSPVDTKRTGVRPTFEFTIGDDIENNSQSFEIQWADDVNFTQNVQNSKSKDWPSNWQVKRNGGQYENTVTGIVDSTYEGGSVKYTKANPFTYNQTYYYRVRGIDESTSAGGPWSDTRSIRVGDVLELTLKNPIETSSYAERIFITPRYTINQDGSNPAKLTIEVTNNGLDTVPVWEDATTEILNNDYYLFKNKVRTSNKWAVNVRFKIEANDTLGTINIRGYGVSYD